jgi:hypothetical protein
MSNHLIPIRLSHLLAHSGVGAIVRGPNELVVVRDIRQWTDRSGHPGGDVIPYMERARAALEVAGVLRQPPIAREGVRGQVDGVCIPVSRFPAWARCPSCGALYLNPWRTDGGESPRCDQQGCNWKPKPKLVQVTWVLADPAGYLAEVPWHYLTHKDARSPEQRGCNVTDRLRLVETEASRRLICGACKSEALFRGGERLGFGTGRQQPWTHDDLTPVREPPNAAPDQLAQVLAINDTRVYSPASDLALVIPPESRVRKGTAVDRLYRSTQDRRAIDAARTPLARKAAIRQIAESYRCTPDDVELALQDIEQGYPLYDAVFTPGQLRESEYDAFLETLPDQHPDEDLVTHDQTQAWQAMSLDEVPGEEMRQLIRGVKHLVRVDRLKAVKVFKGFNRLNGKVVVPPDIVGNSDWLPAVELYGEGVFIALDEDRLSRWSQDEGINTRLQQLLPRFVQSGRDAPNPLSARFLLLHTLSHMLMRQIEAEGGYPAASLTEIIYCAVAPKPMAGVLIHVAVPDLAGSLGGLAEIAEPRRFLGILIRALEHARWCSLDPVCSEHEGQGPGLLNRAACHACTLVPEPACEYGNTLLDRGFLSGGHGDLPAFFRMS